MRFGVAIVVLASLVGVAIAQQGGGNPRSGGGNKLQGEPELRFMLARLDLTNEQKQHSEGLIDEYKARISSREDMSALAGLMMQLQEARQNNDEERVQAVYEEIKANDPTTLARNDFLAGLRAVLTDAQKEKLEKVLTLLENNPTGTVSLLNIFKAALSVDPTPSERRKLDSIHQRFRTEEVAKIGRDADVPKAALGKKFADELRTAFDAARQEKFDQAISALLGE